MMACRMQSTIADVAEALEAIDEEMAEMEASSQEKAAEDAKAEPEPRHLWTNQSMPASVKNASSCGSNQARNQLSKASMQVGDTLLYPSASAIVRLSAASHTWFQHYIFFRQCEMCSFDLHNSSYMHLECAEGST